MKSLLVTVKGYRLKSCEDLRARSRVRVVLEQMLEKCVGTYIYSLIIDLNTSMSTEYFLSAR